MALVTMEVKGVGDMISKLDIFSAKASDRVWKRIVTTAEAIKVNAQARVKTSSKTYTHGKGIFRKEYTPGHVRRNIKVRLKPLEMQAKVTYMGAGWPGKFMEFGTKNQPANPFLGPAGVQEMPKFHSGVKQDIQEAAK